MAKQIKDRYVRSLQVLPQPSIELVLTPETGWAQPQPDLVASRTPSHLARASRSSKPRDAARPLSSPTRSISNFYSHFKFLLPLHRLTCPTYKGRASMLLCFCRPFQHPIRTILRFSPLSALLGLSMALTYCLFNRARRGSLQEDCVSQANTIIITVLLSNHKVPLLPTYPTSDQTWTTKVCSKRRLHLSWAAKPMTYLHSVAFYTF